MAPRRILVIQFERFRATSAGLCRSDPETGLFPIPAILRPKPRGAPTRTSMQYSVNPLTSHETGAEIRGLDLARPLEGDTRRELTRALARYHVLVIRDQKLSSRDFACATGNFGEIMPQAIKGHGSEAHPD